MGYGALVAIGDHIDSKDGPRESEAQKSSSDSGKNHRFVSKRRVLLVNSFGGCLSNTQRNQIGRPDARLECLLSVFSIGLSTLLYLELH